MGPGGGKGGLKEEIRGFSGSPLGELWRSVRFGASYGGGVPGLRRSLRGSGGGLWGAYRGLAGEILRELLRL